MPNNTFNADRGQRSSVEGVRNIAHRYTRRLVITLIAGMIVGWSLLAINPNLGVFAALMLLNITVVGVLGIMYALQSIRFKESSWWLGVGYLLLVSGGIIWAIIDM